MEGSVGSSDKMATPSPPPSHALLGVQAVLFSVYAVSWLLVAWLAKISWRTLSATPSAVAVAGTRWSKRSPALFAFRFTLFVWHLLVLIALGVSNYKREVEGKPKHAHWFYQFFFFTIWNYALQMVAWGVSASASAMALCSA